MKILIQNNHKGINIDQALIVKGVKGILKDLKSPGDVEISLLFVDDSEISRLNKRYLKRNGSTNVLSFPMLDDPALSQKVRGDDGMIGDVVISLDTAQREASLGGLSLEERIIQLLTHGIRNLFK